MAAVSAPIGDNQVGHRHASGGDLNKRRKCDVQQNSCGSSTTNVCPNVIHGIISSKCGYVRKVNARPNHGQNAVDNGRWIYGQRDGITGMFVKGTG